MAVEYRANRKRWGFREPAGVTQNGKRKWHFRWRTQKEAEEAYAAYETRAKLPATTLIKAAESYLAFCRLRRSPKRTDDLGYTIQKWIAPHFGASSDIRDIASESIESFALVLANAGLKPGTIKDYLRDLKAFLNWCIKSRLLAENPFKHADLSGVSKRKTPKLPLDMRAIERGLSVLQGRERIYANLLAYMGLRREEANRVQARDFSDLGDAIWLTVKGTKTAESARTLPVPVFLQRDIRAELSMATLAGDLAVYIGSRKGTYVHDRRKLFKRVSRAAGITIRAKDLRDYFASVMEDPVTAQQMLGHTSLKTTAVYVRQVQQRMLAASAKMRPVGLPFLAATFGCQPGRKPGQKDTISDLTPSSEPRKYLKYLNGA